MKTLLSKHTHTGPGQAWSQCLLFTLRFLCVWAPLPSYITLFGAGGTQQGEGATGWGAVSDEVVH